MQAERFEIAVPQSSLDDLQARLSRTRHARARTSAIGWRMPVAVSFWIAGTATGGEARRAGSYAEPTPGWIDRAVGAVVRGSV